MSLDGFVAGPDQSVDNPLGIGGNRPHQWAFGLRAFRQMHGMEGGATNESTPIIEEMFVNLGASVMGRNSLAPTLLGSSGERLFDGVGDDLHGLELVRTVAAPNVTHLRFARRPRGHDRAASTSMPREASNDLPADSRYRSSALE